MGRIGRLGTQEATNMAKIGFLGLGEMGTPMATRLLHAGHDVIVWNRTVERTAPLAQQGAAVASSPAKPAAGASFVITMLDAVADSPIGPIVAAKRGNVESGHF